MKSKNIWAISLFFFGVIGTGNTATLNVQTNGTTMHFNCTSYSSDVDGNATAICNGTSIIPTIPVGQVPQCTLTSSVSSVVKGGTANLMVSCSPVATSYNWTNAGVTTTISSTLSVSPLATTTYSVIGRNAAGVGNTAIFTLPVSATIVNRAQPTAQSPLEEIKRWNTAFETINGLPHNAKWEPRGQMEYNKLTQRNKPLHYKLPTTW